MEKSKLPFVQHFYKLCEQPKCRLKLLITIIVTILSAIFGSLAIDYNKMFENANMTDHQLDQAKLLGQVGGAVGSVFSAIIGIVITFIVILLISKIMKSDTSGKSIFSATLSYTLVTGIIGLIVIVIQQL
ncbi:YIP1 family protein [Staphylococcus simulans]|uniref:YIP1 family protein n=1 Tax=Staphylococcus simulans TaxID=1286 RepID=UPI003CED3C48